MRVWVSFIYIYIAMDSHSIRGGLGSTSHRVRLPSGPGWLEVYIVAYNNGVARGRPSRHAGGLHADDHRMAIYIPWDRELSRPRIQSPSQRPAVRIPDGRIEIAIFSGFDIIRKERWTRGSPSKNARYINNRAGIGKPEIRESGSGFEYTLKGESERSRGRVR